MNEVVKNDFDWSTKIMQPIAEKTIYPIIWPECTIFPLDTGDDALKTQLDISGHDKMLVWPDNTKCTIAQRFRRPDRTFDDFTLRNDRPSGTKTELEKSIIAYKEERDLPKFYAYGHANDDFSAFTRFRIVKYRSFLKLYLENELPESQLVRNKDGTTFLAWPFKDLPKEVIEWELKKPKFKLAAFVGGF